MVGILARSNLNLINERKTMQLRIQIFIFTFIRTILNTAHRMVYPFLGVFARGLGVEISTLSLVVTSRSVIGMLIPLISSISEKRGRRFGMLIGISIFALAMGLVAVSPSLLTVTLALILVMVGKYLFDPAMQAYLGDRVPYQQRGFAMAVTEMGWSLAFIAGIPLVGFLINIYGWSAPFGLFGGLGLLMFLLIWRFIPKADEHHNPLQSARTNIKAVITSPAALAGIGIAVWASAANELVNLIFGVWLEDSFGLKIAALAAASAIIGLSELSGEGLVAAFTDRLGKPRALALGLIGNALAVALLPFIGKTEWGALIGLFFVYITFEFVMVSHIPLMTEVLPSARATVLSFNLTGHSLGRVIGALLAVLIYQNWGFGLVCLVAVFFNGLGLLALRRLGPNL